MQIEGIVDDRSRCFRNKHVRTIEEENEVVAKLSQSALCMRGSHNKGGSQQHQDGHEAEAGRSTRIHGVACGWLFLEGRKEAPSAPPENLFNLNV